MRLIWTDAGHAALVNAQNDGTNAVTVAAIALGRGTRAAAKTDTALVEEIKRVNAIGGEAVAKNIIHVALRDESADAYAAREFGLIADDGTLLARYAQSAAIIEKATGSTALLVIDAILTDVDATQVQFGGLEFSNPPASETVQGVVELADDAEATAGADHSRAMTPRQVKRVLPGPATTETAGTAERATDTEAAAGEDGERFVTARHLRLATPAATTERPGQVERATNDEADAGTDDQRYMSPAKVRRVLPTAATTQRAGLVERATNEEASARQDGKRYVTPLHLPGPATTSARGLVEQATDAEAAAGTDNSRFVTPRHLRAATPRIIRSGRYTITGNRISYYHGQARTPVRAWVRLYCISAEWGYNAGDYADTIFVYDHNENGKHAPSVHSDRYRLYFPYGDSTFYISRDDQSNDVAGDHRPISTANWRIEICALFENS